jgi:hypothetical protein
MVFTVRVRRADQGLSRRGVLAAAVGGLAAVGLGACDLRSTTALWHLAPDKLLPFLASTVALADTYDAAMRRLPSLTAQLTPLRDAHREHVTALRRELGLAETTPTPPTSEPPTSGSRSSANASTGTGGSASVPPSGLTSTPSTPAPSTPPPSSPPPSSPSTPAPSTPAPSTPPSTPPPSPSAASTSGPALPGDRAGLIAVLRTAERKGQEDAVAACLAAPSYRAALLGSIAACRATHLVVLG